ncbi:MAG: hypothetical protein J7L47_10595 [Candidatus Odinarchaeota archaeon]|nr:hypothetical protein [Candidatus Odinarchaeota archaeon]
MLSILTSKPDLGFRQFVRENGKKRRKKGSSKKERKNKSGRIKEIDTPLPTPDTYYLQKGIKRLYIARRAQVTQEGG